MKQLLKRDSVQSFLIGIIAFVVYWPVFSVHQRVDPDAQYILPVTLGFRSLSDYFSGLLSLQTMDFQPVRDLSLYFDHIAFQNFRTNTFVFQNLLWWTGISFLLIRIVRKLFPEFKEGSVALIVLGFSVYPLFTATLPWGMARKHILSMFFILVSTERLVCSELKLKDSVLMVGSYFLAVFAQPIGIMWPLWAAIYVRLQRRDLWKSFIKTVPFFVIIFILGVIANTVYYEQSPVFLNLFPKKSSALFDVSSQLLALGHYTFTIFIPYFLSFQNTLGQWSTLAGLGVLVIFGVVLYKTKAREALVWSMLSLLSLFTVLQMPEIIQDTYLLLPAVGILIAMISLVKNLPVKNFSYALILIPIWAVMSYSRSHLWVSMSALTHDSFKTTPSCVTAMSAIRTDYIRGLETLPEALDFFNKNECLVNTLNSPESLREAHMIHVLILLNDRSIPLQKRIDGLKEAQRMQNSYGQLYLVVLYIREKKIESEKAELESLLTAMKEIRGQFYDVVIEKDLLPYCRSINHKECIDILSPLGQKNQTPFL